MSLTAPDGTVKLRTQLEASVAAAAGITPALLSADSAEAAGREAWRTFVAGSVAPVAASLAPEIAAKLGGTGAIGFEGLRAADIQGRARSYAALRKGEMSDKDARTICGF